MSENNILTSDFKGSILLPNELTVPAYVLRKIRKHVQNGKTSCITNPVTGESFSYAELDSKSQAVANSLYIIGFAKGDTVIYCSHNAANLHILFLGIWRANGILRSSYPEDTEAHLLERVLESNARWILCDEAQAHVCLQTARAVAFDVRVMVFGNADGCVSVSELYNSIGISECPEFEFEKNDTAIILPTSGTTGKSKGAIFTHETIVRLMTLLESIPLVGENYNSSLLLVGKQTHFSGSLLALSCITAGVPLLMLCAINLPNIILAINKYKPKGAFLFPKFMIELGQPDSNNNCDLSSIEYFSTGGVVVGPALVATARSFPNFRSFVVLYGMTECGLLSTNVEWAFDTKKGLIGSAIADLPKYSCGKLPPETSLIVRDVGSGLSVGSNIKGELYFKSNLICEGYFNRNKETAETFQDGWVRTGDFGYYDENGFVYVVDRVKETFKYFNNHICPSELEDVIVGHPAVAEACVVGVVDPDGGDKIPRAYVVLKQNVSPNKGVANDIITYANDLLASYKHIRGGLFILSKLPQGNTGKVTRRLLLDSFQE